MEHLKQYITAIRDSLRQRRDAESRRRARLADRLIARLEVR